MENAETPRAQRKGKRSAAPHPHPAGEHFRVRNRSVTLRPPGFLPSPRLDCAPGATAAGGNPHPATTRRIPRTKPQIFHRLLPLLLLHSWRQKEQEMQQEALCGVRAFANARRRERRGEPRKQEAAEGIHQLRGAWSRAAVPPPRWHGPTGRALRPSGFLPSSPRTPRGPGGFRGRAAARVGPRLRICPRRAPSRSGL
jgi:hypothetical protein